MEWDVAVEASLPHRLEVEEGHPPVAEDREAISSQIEDKTMVTGSRTDRSHLEKMLCRQ
jgi:hypothetical protein